MEHCLVNFAVTGIELIAFFFPTTARSTGGRITSRAFHFCNSYGYNTEKVLEDVPDFSGE
jgi:hypothetical protein